MTVPGVGIFGNNLLGSLKGHAVILCTLMIGLTLVLDNYYLNDLKDHV